MFRKRGAFRADPRVAAARTGRRRRTGAKEAMRPTFLKRTEVGLLVSGIILSATYFAVRLHGAIGSRLAWLAFQTSQLETMPKKDKLTSSSSVDFSLWSENRIAAYKKLVGAKFAAPLAVLSIPRLALEVPVFDGVDGVTLNRGAGRIPGTARFGSSGNSGIAAHRDGFFRVLKDIAIGDVIELQLLNKKERYTVTSTEIVSSQNVGVLASRSHPTITLVTCYPFYFVGDAPQRFIVHAEESENNFPGDKHTKLTSTNRSN